METMNIPVVRRYALRNGHSGNDERQMIKLGSHVMRTQWKIIQDVTKWTPKGKRPLGCPRQRQVGRVKSDLQILVIINGEEGAGDRKEWRRVVNVRKVLMAVIIKSQKEYNMMLYFIS